METELTSILDNAAPLKTGHRSGPRKLKNWLSPEATDAKKRRRRLERRWKASKSESDPKVYCSACSTANKLIIKSSAESNLECIKDASKNPKRLWSINQKPALISSYGTTFTFIITTTGKLSGFFFLSKDCCSKRVYIFQIAQRTFTFWFWSTTRCWFTFRFCSGHSCWSHSTPSVNV